VSVVDSSAWIWRRLSRSEGEAIMEAPGLGFAAATLFLTIVAVAGCASGDAPGIPEFEVYDSAGVEVVQSGPPILEETSHWRVVNEPILQIGQVDGDLPYLFERISSAVKFPDGRIVVSDGRSLDIRVFGPDGKHQLSFGRRGEGPMEFGGPPMLASRPPDTLVVWDPGHLRLSWYDLTGDLLAQRSLAATVAGFSITRGVNAWQLRPDGTLLWSGRAATRLRDGLSEAPRRIALIDGPSNNSHDFGVFPLSQGLMLDIGIGFGNWFAPNAHGAVGPQPYRVAISAPEVWEVRFFDSGARLQRILRAPISRLPVTSEVRAARRAYLVDWALQFRFPASQGEKVDDRFPVPDSIPAIGSLRWDRSDHLWVGRRVADPTRTEDFDVFDISGRWLSTVHFPRDLGYILEIGEDYVLAKWYDDLGVAYLRLFRLEKPGSKGS